MLLTVDELSHGDGQPHRFELRTCRCNEAVNGACRAEDGATEQRALRAFILSGERRLLERPIDNVVLEKREECADGNCQP